MSGKARSGSALLVVLSFMALMTTMAVCFSVKMRASRLPVANLAGGERNRFLMQAALARAMSEIDADIGDRLAVGWPGRVRGTESPAKTNGVASVLTFEGLAYLPSALVDCVRQRAAYAETARWQRLDFDAGRIAYLAIDVSDLPDANAVSASARRTSATDGRLSLRPFFADESAAKAFDEKLKEGRRAGHPVRFALGFESRHGRCGESLDGRGGRVASLRCRFRRGTSGAGRKRRRADGWSVRLACRADRKAFRTGFAGA